LYRSADRYIETLSEFGITNDSKGPELFIPDEIQFAVSGRMAKLRLNDFNKVIGICPGAKHFTKRWQKEKFAAVCVRFAKEKHAKVLLFGGASDRSDCAAIATEIKITSPKMR